MFQDDLLQILVCPASKQPLRVLESDRLSRLNTLIAESKVVTHAGESVCGQLEAALVREDGNCLYQVRNGIPVMVFDESISCEGL